MNLARTPRAFADGPGMQKHWSSVVKRRGITALVGALVLPLALSACGGDSTSDNKTAGGAQTYTQTTATAQSIRANGAKNVFIRIEPADAAPKEKDVAPVGILTNEAGFFMVKDLPAGRAYVLTAEAKTTEGKALTGVVQTRPPQVSITIALRDDLGLPPSSDSALPAGASTPPPTFTYRLCVGFTRQVAPSFGDTRANVFCASIAGLMKLLLW